MFITLHLDLPDALADEAKKAGLLNSEAIRELLYRELKRKERGDAWTQIEALRDLPGEPMTSDEIEAEIDAVRAERRTRNADRR